jgi:hypothetical protein
MRCCREDRCYVAGDVFRCTWQISPLQKALPQGLEVSVLWYTEGKGDEDLTVHYFHRWSAVRLQELDLEVPQYFETRLPESPLSYNGHLLRIRWCTRMRLFLSDEPEVVVQEPFSIVSSLVAMGMTADKQILTAPQLTAAALH